MIRILAVVNEKSLSNLLERYLSKYYDVMVFNDSEKSLVNYSQDCNFEIVVADFSQLKMDCFEFTKRILAINPKQKFIISAEPEIKTFVKLSRKCEDQFYLFNKPFELRLLKVLIDSIVKSRTIPQVLQ